MGNLTFNKMHNLSNPYQGKAKKVLCVCSAGLLRSPTMANVLHKDYGYNARSCGANPEYALIEMDDALLNWADEIVAVEDEIASQVPDEFRGKVITLDIPDMYGYMDPTLQDIIRAQYKWALENKD